MYGQSSSTLPDGQGARSVATGLGGAVRMGGDEAGGEASDDRGVPLTREQAAAYRAANPPLSPWRVVAVQAAVGLVVAAFGAATTAEVMVGASALYGAAVVVVPGALMAWGMSRRPAGMTTPAGAAGFMLWALVKIVVAVLLLVLAPRVLHPLSWLALLAGMVVCLKVYWVALLWRGRSSNSKS